MKKFSLVMSFLVSATMLFSCNAENGAADANNDTTATSYVQQQLAGYAPVKLTADLTDLSENEKEMIPLLIEAAQIMDDLYWKQCYYGDRDSLLSAIKDPATREFVRINYGPWDKLNSDTPFVEGVGTKYPGAAFYPLGMTKEELESSDVKDKHGQYSLVRRDGAGKLFSVPYHVAYKDQLEKAAALLNKASELAEDEDLKKYLKLRANALLTDNYTESDLAWMDMTDNTIDCIIGPIEHYEDRLYENRTAYESYVLIKDKDWSNRLAKYVAFLPELQEELPVAAKYKAEKPGTSSQLNAYNVVYYAGHCNSAGKTIAVNLPNDEEIQKSKGTRRSQLKNAMQAKFDKIMLPIAKELIDPSQMAQVQFDPFFSNVMFHEVSHGLGIKNTIDGKKTVREALQEQSSWLEEAKADILGLFMVSKLVEKGELPGPIEHYYTTFMAGILRSVRFGAGEAHGKANMLAFNFFEDKGAFEKNANGQYKVNFAKFESAMNELGALILTLQGNGEKAEVEKLQVNMALIRPGLQKSLDKLREKGIPVDVTFEQGVDVLGLK